VPLSDDLAAVADTLHDLAHTADARRLVICVALLADAMPTLVEQARALEGRTVPPHWRAQPYDGQPRGNVTPLRRRP